MDMKSSKIIQQIGMVLMIIGFILKVLDAFIVNNFISPLAEKCDIFFYGGLMLWALGYMLKEKKEKKNS